MTIKSKLNIGFSAVLSLLTPLFLYGCVSETGDNSNSRESSPLNQNQNTSENRQKNRGNGPKNIIIFIGDGMGVSTVTAARIFDGQSKGLKGEENSLAFEDFDNVALIKTYNTNAQVPDSAGTATAILSGYKTNIGAVNVKPAKSAQKMVLNSCVLKNSPRTLTQRAKKTGRSVGVISTARITHATPAAMYGHAVDRGWEADADVDARAVKVNCKGLAAQLLESSVDIALGGGRNKFTNEQIAAWENKGGRFLETANDMTENSGAVPILGLFNDDHMSYEADRSATNEPSLTQMLRYAKDNMSNENGYVIMVEAGRVDHAHHDTNAYRAMRDMQALNAAVEDAVRTAGDDTLIIVTADHSHVLTMAGYPARGNPILGLVRYPDPENGGAAEDYAKADDGKPYTTLGYHNGPNVREADSPALTDNMVQAPDYRQQTAVALGAETHSGEDVPLYATGPGAERFKGVMEQDKIGQIIHDLLGQ